MAPRACGCGHGYPLCCCHLGLAGEALLRASNRASAIAGWPSPLLDPDAVAAHRAAVAAALRRGDLRLEAERCPHRTIPECGCTGMECGPLGRRPGRRVTLDDCVACLLADPS